MSNGVVVRELLCGRENPSLSPPKDFGFSDKCCCNMSDYNHTTFPLDALGLYGERFVES